MVSVSKIASHYPQLSAGDRLLIRQQAEEFALQYRDSTGEPAVASIALLEIFHGRLEEVGIEIPIIAGWIKEDAEMIRRVMKEKNIKRSPERDY